MSNNILVEKPSGLLVIQSDHPAYVDEEWVKPFAGIELVWNLSTSGSSCGMNSETSTWDEISFIAVGSKTGVSCYVYTPTI